MREAAERGKVEGGKVEGGKVEGDLEGDSERDFEGMSQIDL